MATIHKQPNPFAPNPNFKVWIDGEFYPADQAKVSVWDHGLLYGDGIFEGIRIYGGKIFMCDEHLKRLQESAKAIRLTLPMTSGEIKSAMEEAVKVNRLEDGYIRLVVTRGVGSLGLSTKHTANPSLIVIAATITLYPKELYESGLSVICSSYIRNHSNAISPRVKSLNYLNNILAKTEAQMFGAHEALMFNHMGQVAECSGDNIFLVSRGEVHTPDLASGLLNGITRTIVMKLARRRNMPVIEKRLVRHDLFAAEECFLSGTAAEIIGVSSIDGRCVGDGKPGPVTKMFQEDYRKFRLGQLGEL